MSDDTRSITPIQIYNEVKYDAKQLIYVDKEYQNLDQRIKLNLSVLKKILLDSKIIHCQVSILIIYGKRHTGKSFLANYCLRYLHKTKLDAFIACQEPLRGFNWSYEALNSNFGAYIWKHAFILETIMKTKVAVLLIDFQNHIGDNVSRSESFLILCILKLIGSVEILNVSGVLNESYLDYLALACEFSSIIKAKVDNSTFPGKPFQSLNILVRDWQYPFEYYYGNSGGQQYLTQFLSTNLRFYRDKINYRTVLKSHYSTMHAFLLPNPGIQTNDGEYFEGYWNNLSNEFQEYLLAFLKQIFNPQSLVVKEIAGQIVNGETLYGYIESYFNTTLQMASDIPYSLLEASCVETQYNAYIQAIESYNILMKNRHIYSYSVESLLEYHRNCKKNSIEVYEQIAKNGSIKSRIKFLNKIDTYTDETFIRFYAINPTYPIVTMHVLSVNILTIFAILFVIFVKQTFIKHFEVVWIVPYLDTFVNSIIIVLIIYSLFYIKIHQKQIKMSSTMQDTLKTQFLDDI